MDFETYGIDLQKVISEAEENKNEELAKVLKTQVANLQACYDVIAERLTSFGDENIWKIEASYIQERLH